MSQVYTRHVVDWGIPTLTLLHRFCRLMSASCRYRFCVLSILILSSWWVVLIDVHSDEPDDLWHYWFGSLSILSSWRWLCHTCRYQSVASSMIWFCRVACVGSGSLLIYILSIDRSITSILSICRSLSSCLWAVVDVDLLISSWCRVVDVGDLLMIYDDLWHCWWSILSIVYKMSWMSIVYKSIVEFASYSSSIYIVLSSSAGRSL